MKKLYVIIIGTDPKSKKGGISVALPGYFDAMKSAHIDYKFIPTHSSKHFSGKFFYLLKNIPVIIKNIINNKDKSVILYCHAGAGLSLVRKVFVMMLVKRFNVKCILQLHALEIDAYLNSTIKKKLLLLLIANTDRLNVLLPWWKERLLQAGLHTPISVLPNPLAFEWEKIAQHVIIKKNSRDNDNINILSLSRVEPGKGLDLVIESMVYLGSHFQLTIAGDGSLLTSLKARVKALSLSDKVNFTGWVSGDEKQQLFDQSDIFCLPSSYDSFGMVFLEAMANGLPIVAMDWGPISDIVPDNKVGFLVKSNKPELLAQEIKKLSDSKIRINMGRAGKKWVLDKFSMNKVGGQLKIIFEQLINEK